MSEPRKQFTFYFSFYESLKNVPANRKGAVAMALIEYGLFGETFTALKNTEKAILTMAAPVLDKARKRAAAGKNGGSTNGEKDSFASTDCESKNEFASADCTSKKGFASAGCESRGGEGEGDRIKSMSKEGEIDNISLPHAEQATDFSEVFEALQSFGVPMDDKTRVECIKLCVRYGDQAVIQAINRADYQHVPRWPYIRGIITSGGVNKPRGKDPGYMRHGEQMSPMMQEAVRRMMEETSEEGET